MYMEEQLARFCETVRAKAYWETQILSLGSEIQLGVKWAIEAGLLKRQIPLDEEGLKTLHEDELKVLEAIRELQREARRIHSADNVVHLGLAETTRVYNWAQINPDVLQATRFIRSSKFIIEPAPLKEEIGAFIADDIIPITLHQALLQELDTIAEKIPKDWHPGSHGRIQNLIDPSLHPYVINHTALSSLVDKSPHPMLSNYPTFTSSMRHFFFSEEYSSEIHYESKYALIPSIFSVSPDASTARVRSYISGLGLRDHHGELYHLIERVFVLALPLLERTIQHEYVWSVSPSVQRWLDRYAFRVTSEHQLILRSDWEAFVHNQTEEKVVNLEQQSKERKARETQKARERATEHLAGEGEDSPFVGRDLKIIVRAFNYVLQPGETYEEDWKIEGLPHERIVASAVYYYHIDVSLVYKGIEFRRLHNHHHDFPGLFGYQNQDFLYRLIDNQENLSEIATRRESGDPDDDLGSEGCEEIDYPSDWEDNDTDAIQMKTYLGTIPLASSLPSGSMPTRRIITYPNWVQHRLVGLRNVGKVVAQCKTLCFFLVGDNLPPMASFTSRDHLQTTIIRYPTHELRIPTHYVLTTSHVPYQMQCCNLPTLHFLLPKISRKLTGKALPPEIVNLIIHLGSGYGPKKLEIGGMGVSRQIAEKRRREVMGDYKSRAEEEYQLWGKIYSIAE